MAVNTTVEVAMPAMGESVSEGTILEWHKQEGDAVAADETLVEISTDKVDAEVPAPASGTVVKIHVAEGDTVDVGAVLAEIAPTNGAAARRRAPPRPRPRRPPRPASAARPRRSTSTCPRWASRSPRARSSSGPSSRATAVEADETIVEISTDKVDAELPAPARGTLTEILAEAGETVTVGQVLARMTAGAGAAAGRRHAAPSRPSAPRARRRRRRRRARRREGLAGRRARRRRRGRRPRAVTGTGPAGGSPRPTCWPPPRRQRRRAGRRAEADARDTLLKGGARDARPLHGRVALDPDRDLVPHDHRHHAGRPPQAAQGGRPEGLLHAPDRLRDRARGDRADAGHGPPLRRDRRQAARASTTAPSTSASPSTSRRRTARAR